jgi:hypothetical protein
MSNSSINTTNPIGINSGGTFASAQTTYGVSYYSGTQVTTTSAGSATDVLRSNGALLPPSFQASPMGAGGWVLLDTQTAASSVITFSGLDNTYATYVVLFQSVICDPIHNNIYFQFQLSNDNGSTFKDNFNGNVSILTPTGNNGQDGVVGVDNTICGGTNADTPINGIMWFYNISSGDANSGCYMMSRLSYDATPGAFGGFCISESQWVYSGVAGDTSMTDIKFNVGGGVTDLISSGVFSLYGISQ